MQEIISNINIAGNIYQKLLFGVFWFPDREIKT